MEYDLQLKLAEFKINGFTLFEDLVAAAKIDGLCAAFMPLLEHVRARETEIGGAEVSDLRRGTFWVQDPRALHRGTPNTSDGPRPELVICYSLSWFRIGRQVEIHRDSFEQLTDRGKELFSRAEVL